MIRASALIITMALATPAAAASYRQEFPFPKAAVYQALVETLPAVGYKIRDQDPVIGRVTASVGMSAFSAGERLSFVVVGNGPTDSAIEMDGSKTLNVGVMVGGRIQQDFDKAVLAVSKRLQAAPQ